MDLHKIRELVLALDEEHTRKVEHLGHVSQAKEVRIWREDMQYWWEERVRKLLSQISDTEDLLPPDF